MNRKWIDRMFIERNDFMPLREKIQMYKISSMQKFLTNNQGVKNFNVEFQEEWLNEEEIQEMLNQYVREDMTYFLNGKKIDYQELKEKIKENTMKLTIIYREVR